MNIKLIAIGSRIMGDDGAAIEAAERLFNELVVEGVQVIIGETDVEYCLSCINEGDFIIILDAAISGRPWGTVWQLPLNHALMDCGERQFQHDADLLSILKTKEMPLSGLLICIEAADISQRWGLSEAITSQLPKICNEIKKIILKYRGDLQYA
jgi:hydrogenase maturation protease